MRSIKAIISVSLLILGGCSSNDRKNPEPVQHVYSGTYSVNCISYPRSILSHEPLGPDYSGIRSVIISIGTKEGGFHFKTYGDSLSITLNANAFSFDFRSDSVNTGSTVGNFYRTVSGSGQFSKKSGNTYFSKDSISYERIYTYRKNQFEYEEWCICAGPKIN